MDAIIKQTVREEIRRTRTEGEQSASNAGLRVQPTEGTSTSANPRSTRTVNRLSGLLSRIRDGASRGGKSGKKRKTEKECRVQVRWIHYDSSKDEFVNVRQKNGGGNRFITYTESEHLSVGTLTSRACALFFPEGKSVFAGPLETVDCSLCDSSRSEILEFPGDGTVDDYLKQNGLYASTTYFYLRTESKSHGLTVDSDVDELFDTDEITFFQNVLPTIICPTCSCTYQGTECLRCQQNTEYEQCVITDMINCDDGPGVQQISSGENSPALSLAEMRQCRVSFLLANNTMTTELSDTSTTHQHQTDIDVYAGENNCYSESDDQNLTDVQNNVNGNSATPAKVLRVHRSMIRKDLIEHFMTCDIMEYQLTFEIINEMGVPEMGVGIGVTREVFSLFWKDFFNGMTIGERERVPFVRHDHFIKEWEAIGRILVKGYISASYFPVLLSQAFLSYCLFGDTVSDEVMLMSFKKYLSPEEEELVNNYLAKDAFPEDNEELLDFLDRFNCRALVTKDNLRKVLVEISKQELIQKPHVMISTWQPLFQDLKQFPCLKTLSALQSFFDTLKPSNKKVLDMFEADPKTDAERDALKFLQRYVRGLDNSKLLQFLRFTTAMDIITDSKLSISFTKSEGLACRPIAHTCGPTLELPATYSNFVELREQFNNILDKSSWNMDIV